MKTNNSSLNIFLGITVKYLGLLPVVSFPDIICFQLFWFIFVFMLIQSKTMGSLKFIDV